MPFYLTKHFIADGTMHALFITLIHSLWQGILVALIASAIVVRTKTSNAGLRYKLLCGTLLLFILVSAATFCYELRLNISNNNSFNTASVASAAQIKNAENNLSLIENVKTTLLPYENFIMAIWFAIIMFKSAKFLTGLRRIYILKRKKTFDAGEYWNIKLKELADKTGITKPVYLLKSAIAEMPLVIGHLKPVILFPAAAFIKLPPQEIEAILLHELAHIRRKDYIVNMLQNLAEIIFFFNPAVLWISSLIKEERENCCDDIAVNHTKNRKQFIHALVAFEKYNLNRKYATSFAGNKMHLLNRIKRIITNNNKTLSNMEKILLASGVIIAGFAVLAFKPAVNKNAVIYEVKSFNYSTKKDTVVPMHVNNNESKTIINTSLNGKQYKLVESNDKVIELYVNGERISDDKIAEYKPVIDSLNNHMNQAKQKQVEAMKAQAEAIKAQASMLAAQSDSLHTNDVAMQAEDMAKQAQEMDEKAEAIAADNDRLAEQAQQLAQQNYSELMSDSAAYEANKLAALAHTMDEKSREILNEKVRKEIARNMTRAKALAMQAEIRTKEQMQQQVEQMKIQQKKLLEQSEILKQQQKQMKAEMDKQTEIIKEHQLQMKTELEKQTEQLREQREELIQQLKQEVDSIHQVKP